MKEIKAIFQQARLDEVLDALKQIPALPGGMVSEVKGFGRSRTAGGIEETVDGVDDFVTMVKLEIVVPDSLLDTVLAAIRTNAHRGRPGDGKIFISTVDDVIKIRTGERGDLAI